MGKYTIKIDGLKARNQTTLTVSASIPDSGKIQAIQTRRIIVESTFIDNPTPNFPPINISENWAPGEFRALLNKYSTWVGGYNGVNIRSYKFNVGNGTYTATTWGAQYQSYGEKTSPYYTIKDWGDNKEFARVFDGGFAKVTIDLQNGVGPQLLMAHCYSSSSSVKKGVYRLWIPLDANWRATLVGRYIPDIIKVYVGGENTSVQANMMKLDSSKPIGRIYKLSQADYQGCTFEQGSLSFSGTPSFDTRSNDWDNKWTFRGAKSGGQGYMNITMNDGTKYKCPIYG